MKRLAVLLLVCTAAFAQEGALLYKKHCAQCHESVLTHAPGIRALQAMSETALLRVMETGTMQEPAKSMTAQERKTLAAFLSSSSKAQSNFPASAMCKDLAAPIDIAAGPTWNGFGAGPFNTRFQSKESAALAASDIPKLRLKWAFNLGNLTMARGQPVVVGNRLFVGTSLGDLYSLDAKTGCIYWTFPADSAIRSGVVAGNAAGRPLIFFGDARANTYGVDIATGKLVWKMRPEDHPAAVITGAPNYYDGAVYFGISSLEEFFGAQPTYECCTFRGTVVALNAATGATLWKTYTIADTPKPTSKTKIGVQRHGPSGAAVWSTPTIDVKRNALYVATGDNYSDPATATSDAVLALDRTSGKLLWSRQMTTNDAFNVACLSPDTTNCPESNGPDLDFGQPPILVTVPNGRDELVIGQKSGVAWAIDPEQQGKVLWQTRVGRGGALGGSQWGSAADGHAMYVSISDINFLPTKDAADAGKIQLDPSKGGGLYALDLISGSKLWSAAPTPCGDRKNCSPAQPAAVSAIPGVVFLGSLDGHFRAYSSASGEVLWDFDAVREYAAVNGPKAQGGAMDGGGSAIAGGMVYVNAGYDQWGEMPGNVLLAFSVDGK